VILDKDPVRIGPTWAQNPNWDGVDQRDRFLLPEKTLGWQILAWGRDNINNEFGQPFEPTFEQARFILWWYAVDERGRFVYRKGILQRLKGWGRPR
jgi:hypothetical protein